MQPLTLNASDVSMWVGRMWWPVLRIGGFVLAAPVASEAVIPRLVKIVLTLALAFLMGPLVQVPAGLSIFSGSRNARAVLELLIGVAIGMVVQLAFEALVFAGQSISLTMGLGFATLVDPQRGAQTPVLGQMFMIFGTLTYLAINGHLVLLGALAQSFHTLPIGAAHVDKNFLLSVVLWGARVFDAGLLIALPAVIALVIVNLALGVVTRAAPQLNLFGIGFTITLLCGFFVLHRRPRRHHVGHLQPHSTVRWRRFRNWSARPPRECPDGRIRNGRRTHRRTFATTPTGSARTRANTALAGAHQLRDHDRRQRGAGCDRRIAGRSPIANDAQRALSIDANTLRNTDSMAASLGDAGVSAVLALLPVFGALDRAGAAGICAAGRMEFQSSRR